MVSITMCWQLAGYWNTGITELVYSGISSLVSKWIRNSRDIRDWSSVSLWLGFALLSFFQCFNIVAGVTATALWSAKYPCHLFEKMFSFRRNHRRKRRLTQVHWAVVLNYVVFSFINCEMFCQLFFTVME